ncbi:MAG: HEPN domain-containing protein [Candidatus Bathyarchaeota archaeon]|nr:HEPN domain-containing protein [Candidatus Bathyarchaeota archaeon]
MVYSGGPPPQTRENWRAWFTASFRFNESAEREQYHNYEVADYSAKHSVELALKGLIEAKEGNIPRQFVGGRMGHSILDLWEYAIENGWVESTDIPSVVIERISHTDVADPDTRASIIDCITGMIAHEKYPHDGYAPHELMDVDEVNELVSNCRQVVEILYQKACE